MLNTIAGDFPVPFIKTNDDYENISDATKLYTIIELMMYLCVLALDCCTSQFWAWLNPNFVHHILIEVSLSSRRRRPRRFFMRQMYKKKKHRVIGFECDWIILRH